MMMSHSPPDATLFPSSREGLRVLVLLPPRPPDHRRPGGASAEDLLLAGGREQQDEPRPVHVHEEKEEVHALDTRR